MSRNRANTAGTSGDAARPDPSAERLRAALIARRHLVEGLTKVEIADAMGISRFKVARLLELARREGIVRIEIVPPFGVRADLGQQLQDDYGLDEAWVVDAGEADEEEARSMLGKLGAMMLADILEPGDVLGVSWGSTMRAVVDALPHLAECTVVQVAGGLPGDPGDGAAELVRRVAGRTSGEVYQLHAPLFVGDAATAARLRAEPQILRTTAMFPRLTKLIVGLGSWGPDTPVAGALAAEDLRALEAASPRAELCGLFIGEDGTIIETPLTRRTLAISPDELRAVPDMIAVTGGPSKTEALRAVLRAGICSRLVTDRATAEGLLAHGG